MKTKIIVLLIFLVSIGIAQQNKTAVNFKDSKELKDSKDLKDFKELKDSKELNDTKLIEELKKYPAPLTAINPIYPEVAKLGGVQGKVYVEASIDEKGNVTGTKIIRSDHETLNYMAMDAIKKTKFTPGISKENKKVKCKVVIPINFKLDDKPKVPDVGAAPEPPVEISDPDINAFEKVEKMPEMIEAGTPVYPEEAKKNNITGKTFVKVLISKEGTPKKAVVIKSDNELFNQPAIDAAMKSKFSSALQEGKPVAVWVVLPYRFTLDGKKDLEEETTHVIMINKTDKLYPSKAIEQKLSGKVFVKVFFDESDGKLQKVELVKGSNEILDNAALEIIKTRFDKYLASEKRTERLWPEKEKKPMPEKMKFTTGTQMMVIFNLSEK